MATKIEKCSPETHQYDLKYLCNHQGCNSRLLCNLCYQTHYQVCQGIFGKAIRELDQPQPGRCQENSNNESQTPIENTFEEISDNRTSIKNSTKITAEEFIAPYNAMKSKVEQPISEVLKRKEKICKENLESLEPVNDKFIKLIHALYETWRDEQDQKLIGMSESSQNMISRLEEIQAEVKGMHFDPANLVRNNSQRHDLETRIDPEAEELVKSIHQVMDGWVLNQDRINDYQEAVTNFLRGIEFTSLLNKEKLEFQASSLPQVPDAEIQKIRKEVEVLRSGDLELKELVHKLRQENKIEVEKLRESIEILTRERNTAQADLKKEKGDRKADLDAEIKIKDAQIAKIKSDANTTLEEERRKNKTALDDVTKKLENVAKEKNDFEIALEKERKNIKTKDETIAKLTQEIIELKAKILLYEEDDEDFLKKIVVD